MPAPFDAALHAAIDLLRELPRDRTEAAASKARFAGFCEAHPGTPARLAIDRRPGSPLVEYDILLEHPDGGTVGVTWRPDTGNPWTVEYADHWASNFVVTVDGKTEDGVTLQEAMLVLKLAADRYPDLMERVIEEKLVALSIEAGPPGLFEVRDEELQAAADAYRSTSGLTEPGSMRRRLEEWGITVQRFQEMLARGIQRRKLRERVTAGQVEPYFEAHREELRRVRVLHASGPSREVLERLAEAAPELGLAPALAKLTEDPEADGIEATLATRLVADLPEPADEHGLVGPFESGGRWCVAQVLARYPAQLDERTRAEVQRRLFQRFLAEKREAARVRWHWL